MIYLRQSTASQEVPLGYFVDATDGNTEEAALTIANTDIKLWKAGATALANKNSGGATHIANGIYYTTLDATDTNTLGALRIFVHVAGALPFELNCCVLAAHVYDALIAGTHFLPATTLEQVWSIAGTTLTTRAIDGTTVQATKAIATTSGALPITGVS